MPHPSINQQITFLYTRDLEQIARFCEQIIGLSLTLDQGSCRIYQVVEGAFVGFCQRDVTPEQAENTVIFTLVTQEVDAWYDYLRKQGVTIEKPPAENPAYKIHHFFLRDPNGYLIEIQRFNHQFP